VRWAVRGIASPPVASGLRLAGIPTEAVSDGDAAAARLGAMAADRDLGILLVEERLLDAIPPVVRREVERRPAPIIVPVPPPAWGEPPADAEGLILELLRRAVGYRVKLR
jgi:vacuolar-type H+-ATPase subunit F/Vma7